MTTGPYHVVEVDGVDDKTECTCDNCCWTGTADQTVDVDKCVLQPGAPSPVGRCPVCDALAYPAVTTAVTTVQEATTEASSVRKLFYVECETNPNEHESTIRAFLVSAVSASQSDAEEVISMSMLERHHVQSVTHIRFVGNTDGDVFEELGELAG